MAHINVYHKYRQSSPCWVLLSKNFSYHGLIKEHQCPWQHSSSFSYNSTLTVSTCINYQIGFQLFHLQISTYVGKCKNHATSSKSACGWLPRICYSVHVQTAKHVALLTPHLAVINPCDSSQRWVTIIGNWTIKMKLQQKTK